MAWSDLEELSRLPPNLRDHISCLLSRTAGEPQDLFGQAVVVLRSTSQYPRCKSPRPTTTSYLDVERPSKLSEACIWLGALLRYTQRAIARSGSFARPWDTTKCDSIRNVRKGIPKKRRIANPHSALVCGVESGIAKILVGQREGPQSG
ncbi:hypothetical protein KCV00_g222, partial [Aureobasidium melanogenum]